MGLNSTISSRAQWEAAATCASHSPIVRGETLQVSSDRFRSFDPQPEQFGLHVPSGWWIPAWMTPLLCWCASRRSALSRERVHADVVRSGGQRDRETGQLATGIVSIHSMTRSTSAAFRSRNIGTASVDLESSSVIGSAARGYADIEPCACAPLPHHRRVSMPALAMRRSRRFASVPVRPSTQTDDTQASPNPSWSRATEESGQRLAVAT